MYLRQTSVDIDYVYGGVGLGTADRQGCSIREQTHRVALL